MEAPRQNLVLQNPPKPFLLSNERLQQLIAPSSPRARWNESKMKDERGMRQENGSITIAQEMVRK
jgi:hypothetical protein